MAITHWFWRIQIKYMKILLLALPYACPSVSIRTPEQFILFSWNFDPISVGTVW